jgi:hypothetical protein
VVRSAAAVLAGVVAGVLMISSMKDGAEFMFPGEEAYDHWSLVRWGEHWAWRVALGLLATYFAGFIAGLAARRLGRRHGMLSAVPSAALWAWITWAAWTGRAGLAPQASPLEMPLGWKLAASSLALLVLPVGAAGGAAGAPFGAANGPHYDARRRSLLGVRWYHFVWIYPVVHVLVLQSTWAGMYGLGWTVKAWQAALSMFNIVPMLFTVGIWMTLVLAWTGAWRAYEALAGFDDEAGPRLRAYPTPVRVVVHGIGWPLGAAAIQAIIAAIHYGLAKLFS